MNARYAKVAQATRKPFGLPKPIGAKVKAKQIARRKEGLLCPSCGFPKSVVIDSRKASESAWRRRRVCLQCHARYTTLEQVMAEFLYVPNWDI
jgi:hypothetical protein